MIYHHHLVQETKDLTDPNILGKNLLKDSTWNKIVNTNLRLCDWPYRTKFIIVSLENQFL